MLSSVTSFLSFSLRFLILQVLRFTMRDWLNLPLTTNNNNEDLSWFTILNVFSVARKMKANTPRQITEGNNKKTSTIVNQEEELVDIDQSVVDYEEDTYFIHNDVTQKEIVDDTEEEEEESHLPRTFSSSSIATSTNTEHSSPAHFTEAGKFYFTSATTTTNVKIYWNHGGDKVQVTGEFDNWSVSVNMVQDDDHRYFVEIPMDLSKDIEYKFVVDGEWKYAIDLPHRSDWSGNINNVIYKK